MLLISIIIVNWNGKKDTLECLESLRSLVLSDGYIIAITVVDNASSDDSIYEIKRLFPYVNIIQNTFNLGFAEGNNVGIIEALKSSPDFIWLLNNDTLVDKNTLIKLVDAASKDNVGIVGGKIFFEKGYEFHKDRYKSIELGKVLWYAGGKIDWNNIYASHIGVDEVDIGQYNEIIHTEFVTGCSMFIKSALFHKIGLFDQKYYLYLEDVDFCMRAKLFGYNLLYQPEAKIWHKNAGSTTKPGNKLQQYYLTRNRILFGIKYASLRAKFALLRESLRLSIFGTGVQKNAIKDAVLGKFGGRYIWKK